MNISLSVEAKSLGKSLDFIDEMVRNALEARLNALATATMAKAQELARDKLHTTLQDYLNALSMKKTKNQDSVWYILSLAPEADWIESGGPEAGFDIKPGVLAGSRSLHISKEGKRYKHVPFFHKPYGKAQLGGKRGEIQSNLRDTMDKYGLAKIIKATGNKAMQGRMSNALKSQIKSELSPELQGLRKYSHKYGKATQSQYMTFRTISENSPDSSWRIRNPWLGAKIFPELTQFVREEMRSIIAQTL